MLTRTNELTAYAFAYSDPFDVDEPAATIAHHVVVSVTPSWRGSTQLRRVQFPEPGTLVPSATEPIVRTPGLPK